MSIGSGPRGHSCVQVDNVHLELLSIKFRPLIRSDVFFFVFFSLERFRGGMDGDGGGSFRYSRDPTTRFFFGYYPIAPSVFVFLRFFPPAIPPRAQYRNMLYWRGNVCGLNTIFRDDAGEVESATSTWASALGAVLGDEKTEDMVGSCKKRHCDDALVHCRDFPVVHRDS